MGIILRRSGQSQGRTKMGAEGKRVSFTNTRGEGVGEEN